MCKIKFNSNDLPKVNEIVSQHQGYINNQTINIPDYNADNFYGSILGLPPLKSKSDKRNITMKCCFISMKKIA